jgi:hypothetical protein
MKRFLFLGLFVSFMVKAGGFAPVPPDVWAIKEDSAKGIVGALVLEDRTAFRGSYVEFTYRVRILSESGRDAAQVSDFSSDAYDIEGRTVYPDGKEVRFTKKDFTTKTLSRGISEIEQKVVIPPGVNANCLVEILWKESAGRLGVPKHWGYSHERLLANSYSTREIIFELPSSYRLAYQFIGSKTHKVEPSDNGGGKRFAIHDVPARKGLEYGLAVTRDFPRFMTYFQPEQLRRATSGTPDAYWKLASTTFYKNFIQNDVKKGAAFQSLLAELSRNLPTTPHAQAFELMTRLQGRIRNSSQITFEEFSKLTKKQADEEIEAQDLEASVKRGSTNGLGMTLLYFHLLQDRGLNPLVALVANRETRLFKYQVLNPYQFSGELIGVEEQGKGILWFSPPLRFAQPGLVHPDYQGTAALMLNPKADWAVSKIQIPAQNHLFNRRQYTYKLDLLEDADRFQMAANFVGYPEYVERSKYMRLEPKEQTRLLKEELEGLMKSATFSKVEVIGAQDPKENVHLEIEGQIERENGRRREVYPFPSMEWPIWVPNSWPEKRTEPIVIPYLRTHTAVSTFKIPAGYNLPTIDPFVQQNGFGKVQWLVSKDANGEVKVQLRVDVTMFFAGPETYEELKTFLGWVKDASFRTLVMEKVR